MTAPFPTHKQEEWRYADLDALKPVWEQFAEPVTLTVGLGESFEEVWLPATTTCSCGAFRLRSEQVRKREFSRSTSLRFTGASSLRCRWRRRGV